MLESLPAWQPQSWLLGTAASDGSPGRLAGCGVRYQRPYDVFGLMQLALSLSPRRCTQIHSSLAFLNMASVSQPRHLHTSIIITFTTHQY